MGDRVCNEDSSIFGQQKLNYLMERMKIVKTDLILGMMCQIVYHDRGPFNAFVMSINPII